MKYLVSVFLFSVLLTACHSGKSIPDVSGITVNLQTIRFEKDFFGIDTLHINTSLQQLENRQPGFTKDFLYNILGTSPDSAENDIRSFIRTYASMYTASQKQFPDFSKTAAAVKRGLQFVHYYFPGYPLPEKLITFIGPINSYGNIITPRALAVGLQLYMGGQYPLYLTEQGQEMYPLFVSRRFEPEYIPVNCMKNIIDDMFPNNSMGKPLVQQMVESGKRLYLLNLLLPETADTLTTGYTEKQLQGCRASERNIWSFFIQNDMLFKNDPNLTRDYMNDGPNTAALGEASPGNIGQFVGWQIVQKWMEAHPETTPAALMKKDPGQLFSEARYKPK